MNGIIGCEEVIEAYVIFVWMKDGLLRMIGNQINMPLHTEQPLDIFYVTFLLFLRIEKKLCTSCIHPRSSGG